MITGNNGPRSDTVTLQPDPILFEKFKYAPGAKYRYWKIGTAKVFWRSRTDTEIEYLHLSRGEADGKELYEANLSKFSQTETETTFIIKQKTLTVPEVSNIILFDGYTELKDSEVQLYARHLTECFRGANFQITF